MLFEVDSAKAMEELDKDLREAAAAHQFGVLGVHDLEQTLQQKGHPLHNACRVYEICNARQANQVLTHNMGFSSLLPCRVSVYGTGGKLRLSTVLPTSLFSLIADSKLEPVAKAVEEDIKAMMQEAAQKAPVDR